MGLFARFGRWAGGHPGAPADDAGDAPAPVPAAPRWQRRTGERVVWMRHRPVVAPVTCPPVAAVGDSSAGAPAGADSPGAGLLGWLVVRRSPDAGRVGQLLELHGKDTVITRGAASSMGPAPGSLAFDDEFMSSDHARITRAGDAFVVIERVGERPAANGVIVNGRRLPAGESRALVDGDLIRLGATDLVFKQLAVSSAEP